MASDRELKAIHAVRMMLIARQLAMVAPSDRQQRMLARYVLLHADSAVRWESRWIDEEPRSSRDVPSKRALRRLRQEYAKQKTIRDTIATRRQAIENGRAADLRATLALWQQLTYAGATRLCELAQAVCDAFGAGHRLLDAIVDSALLEELRDSLRATQLDTAVVYLDATSYAAGESNLLPITVTGLGGRRIMQINDVHDNLNLLTAVRPLVGRGDDVGLLLTAALIVEVYSLMELVIGPPTGEKSARDGPPLLDLVSRDRGPEGYAALEQVRTHVVPEQTRVNLLALRDRCAAHLDTQTSYTDIRETLRTVNVDDLFLAADNVLDTLDRAARAHVDLGHLVIGHPEFKTLQPIDHWTTPATFLPDEHAHFLDEPFGCFVGAGFGPNATAYAAAAVSRRAAIPRARWSRPT